MNHVSTKEKFVHDIKEVIADSEVLLRETAHDLTGKAQEAGTKLARKLEDVKKHMGDVESVVKEKALEGARQTDRLVREHPYESIGVAFGVGLLIGILINRK